MISLNGCHNSVLVRGLGVSLHPDAVFLVLLRHDVNKLTHFFTANYLFLYSNSLFCFFLRLNAPFAFLHSYYFLDARQSVCFTHLDPSDNRCAKPNGLSLTKSTCCCSMNAGWGDPCELCPKKESKEFKYYCPNGVGLEKNNTGKYPISSSSNLSTIRL